MTLVPIISWSQLISFIYIRRFTSKKILTTWTKKDQLSCLLSRSSWSLALIVWWKQKIERRRDVLVVLPSYFCDSSLRALEIYGARLKFYESTDLENGVNQFLKSLDEVPDVFLYVHYFGYESSLSNELRLDCHNKKIWLIEDCTHCLIPHQGIGQTGDFILYSPHKLIATPSGAVLVVNQKGPNKLATEIVRRFGEPENWINGLHEANHNHKLRVLPQTVLEFSWLARRLIQKIGILRQPLHPLPFNEDGDSSRNFSSPKVGYITKRSLQFHTRRIRFAELTQRLTGFPVAKKAMDKEIALRQINYLTWASIIQERFNGCIKPVDKLTATTIPYNAAFQGPYDEIESFYSDLQRLNIPVTTWPDLPQEFRCAGHSDAQQKRRTRVFLPIHSAVTPRKIAKIVPQAKDQSSQSITVAVVKDIEKWNQFLSEIRFSNLQMTWEYGAGKEISEGWSVNRYVVSHKNRNLALVQTMEKRILKVIPIARMARTPLFFPEVTSQEKKEVLSFVLNFFSKRKICSFSPEILVEDGSDFTEFSAKRMGGIGWTSSVIDLSKSEIEIRNNFSSKWRNQIMTADKAGIEIVIETEWNSLESFVNQYDDFMRIKQFDGLHHDFHKALLQQLSLSEKVFVVSGLREGEIVGRITIALHGNGGTYLAGWNTESGQRANITNALLWKAIIHLKQRGISSFDTGGLDLENEEGIANFKLGLGGNIYRLTGEFVKT